MGNEHHFVPKFYLRNFSNDQKRVELFNIARNKYVPLVSIKHQCSKRGIHNFNPEVEGALAGLEGSVASIVRRIVTDISLQGISDSEFATLMLFVVLQRSRTLAAASESDQMIDWFAKMTMAGRAEDAGIDLSKIRISEKYPLAALLSAAVRVFPSVLDLKCHLLLNETDEEFLTSDNPVVVHNQFAEFVSGIGVDGWECRGIQVFLPIDPTIGLLIYDAEVYEVTDNGHGRSLIRRGTVASLNGFQILNAMSNIYFKSPAMAELVERRVPHLAEARSEPRVKFVRTKPIRRSDDTFSELVSHYRPLLPRRLNLDCFEIREPWRNMPDRDRAPLWRHPPYRPVEPAPGEETKSYQVRSNGPADWKRPPWPPE